MQGPESGFNAKHAEQAENKGNAIVATAPEFSAALRREGLPSLDLPLALK
ncbi:MAG TPA: hypothetical protein VF472_05470 [Burkholderiaceae bacterium]